MFTLSKSNVRSICLVAEAFRLGKEEKERFVRTFMAEKDQFGYFTLDVENMSFVRGDSPPQTVAVAGAAAPLDVISACRKTLEEYSDFLSHPEKALKIFNFIASEIPTHSLDPQTLLLTLKTRGGGGALVKISLLDYLSALNSQEKPGADLIRLHLYLSRRVSLPKVFVQNEHFRRLVE